MPGPVSNNPTPPIHLTVFLRSTVSRPPPGMASSELSARLTNTCCNGRRPPRPQPIGWACETPGPHFVRLARPCTNASVCSTSRASSCGDFSGRGGRAKLEMSSASSPFAEFRLRLPKGHRSGISGFGLSRAISTSFLMDVKGLRISCATPAAN